LKNVAGKIAWTLAAVFSYALALVAMFLAPELGGGAGAGWRVAQAALYGGFGVALLGLLGRSFPLSGPNVWRLAAVALGAAATAAGLWLTLPAGRGGALLDAWMVALLGLAVAAMLPRWLPTALTRRWLGIERRHTSAN
jgi:hypothetical protein